jgi:hypothetical protein
LWELPLAEGMELQHAILAMNGVNTIPTEAGFDQEFEDMT